MKLEIEFVCSECYQIHKEETMKSNYSTKYRWYSLSEAVQHCKEWPDHTVTAETEFSI